MIVRSLLLALATFQDPTAEAPLDVIRHATAAVEGDSVAAVEAGWRRRVSRDGTDRLAALGLAVLAQLTYADSAARARYAALLPASGQPGDAVAGYAAINLARMAALAGRWPRADTLAAAGVAAGRVGDDPALAAEAWVVLASVRARLVGTSAALALLDSAEAAVPAGTLRVRGLAKCTRAQVLSFGADPRALDLALEGAALAAQAPDARTRGICRGIAAADLARRGMADSAFQMYGRVIADYRQARDRGGLAVALQWRSHALRQLGFLGRARYDATEAIAEAEASGVRVVIPWALATRAFAALALNDLPHAAVDAGRAAREFENQGDLLATATVRGLEGDLALAAGDTATARVAYQTALDRARSAGWAEPQSGIYRSLMHVALLEGDLPTARAALDTSVALAARHGMAGIVRSSDYFEAVLSMREGRLQAAERLLRARVASSTGTQPNWSYLFSARLAEVLARTGRLDEAEREIAAADDALDAWRSSLRDRDLRLLAQQLSEDRSDPDLGLAFIVSAMLANRQVQQAFDLVERRRARSLADRLNRAAAADTAAGERVVRTEAVTTLAQIQNSMPDDSTAILEFVTGGGGEPSSVIAVTWRDLRFQPLPPEDSLAPLIARFVTLIESGDEARELGRTLAAALLDSALYYLPPVVHRLIIVPDGILHRVPFDALVLSDGRHAVERYAIATAPSATVARALWDRPVTSRPAALVIADPKFEPELNTPLDADAFRSAMAGVGGLPRLRGSGREARMVARFLPEPTVRRRGGASEAWLKREALTRFGILHFATHALVDQGSLANTALALAPGDGEDGFLHAGEIGRLDLSAELVVLSACRTAGGALIEGEGVQGLAAALLAAGVRTVAATWWPVSDLATGRMVSDFYAALADSLPAADALRRAKLAALERGAPINEWAAFTIVGDPMARPVVRGPVAAWPRRLAVPLVATLLGVYGVWMLRRRRVERR